MPLPCRESADFARKLPCLEIKMKKTSVTALSVILALATLFSLTSCLYSTELVPCDEVLGALVAAEIGLPAGKLYSSQAKEGEEGYISKSLITSLYGDGEATKLVDGWIEYSFFLPTGDHPCEFAVILCDTPETAKDTARLLCRRLNDIRSTKDGEKYPAHLDGATVTISRNYVVLIISSDNESAKRTALTMIG